MNGLKCSLDSGGSKVYIEQPEVGTLELNSYVYNIGLQR